MKTKSPLEMLSNMSTIRSDLRLLIAKYGLPAVQQELQAEMRETYEFLKQQFETSKNNLVIPLASTIPNRIATPHLNPMKNIVNQMEVPSLELASPEEEESDMEEEEETKVEPSRDPSLKDVVIQAKKELAQEFGEKFTKAKHKELVAEKYKELVAKGIKPESLLTKENLTLWLGQGLSYMRIAREHVGVSENEVSAVAKTFGLQSDIKKFIVMKKGGK